MHRLSALALATLIGSAASAQDLYVGGTVDYMRPHKGDTQTVSSAIAGMTFDVGIVDVGAEAEYGLQIAGENDYDAARVRGWVSYDLGRYTLRAGGGITEYYFGDTNYGGYHALLGAERSLTDNISVRGEFIRDFVDDAFVAGITATRIGVVLNF